MKAKWRDVTSYSRDDKDRDPSVWYLQLTSEVRISLVRKHRLSTDSWCFHCAPWFDTHSLNLQPTVENRDEATRMAVALVTAKVAALAEAIREINT